MATLTAPGLQGTFAADPVHSSFGFAVRYQGVSVFRGSFDDVAATLADGRLQGTASVESISIRTPEQFRAHVLAPDFFDAAAHPEITFTSSDVRLADDGTATVLGDLTMKGITQPVVASGTWAPPAADAFGSTRAHLALESVIERSAFGMTFNRPLPGGGDALGDEVTISVDLALLAEAGPRP